MPLDSSPETLLIEIEVSGVWTDVSLDYTVRDSVRREAPSSGSTAKLACTIIQTGGGLNIKERQRIRVKDPATNKWLFRGEIMRFTTDSDANEKMWDLACEDASIYLDRGSGTLPQGYTVAAGTSDRDAIRAFMPLYCPEIGTGGVNTIITSLPQLDLSYMTPREALQEIQKYANSAQQPDFFVCPDVTTSNPQLCWFDWNNPAHTPTLSIELTDQGPETATNKHYESLVPTNDGGFVLTRQVVAGRNSSEGTIDGSVDGPEEVTAEPSTDRLLGTSHGLANGTEVYVDSTGTLPSPLQRDTEYYVRDATTNTLKLGQIAAQLAPLSTYAEPDTDRMWATGHGFKQDLAVSFSTTGTLPAPLVAGTVYYVKEFTTNSYKLSATIGGAAIDITDMGSGTHQVTGGVPVDILTAGSGVHTVFDVRFDQVARDSYLHYGSRNFSGKPIKTETADTNHECRLLARAFIHAHGGARRTISLSTYADLDPIALGGPRKVRVGSTLHGLATTDPAWPIVRSSLVYEDGIAKWYLELGDRFIEVGEEDLPGQQGGRRYIGDTTAPAVPSGFAELENVVEEGSGTVRLRVGWNANTEADIHGYYPRVYDPNLDRYFYPPFVAHDSTPSSDLTGFGFGQGITLAFQARAIDRTGNLSRYSDPFWITTAEALPSRQIYNGGFEIAYRYIPTRPDGWTPTTAGGGAVRLTSTQVRNGLKSLELDAESGVGGTMAAVLSRMVATEAGYGVDVSLWAFGEVPSLLSALTVKVHWYNAARTLLSTTTLVSGATVQNTWALFSYSATAPANTRMFRVEIGDYTGGSLGLLYIDDVETRSRPPAPSGLTLARTWRVPDDGTIAGELAWTTIPGINLSHWDVEWRRTTERWRSSIVPGESVRGPVSGMLENNNYYFRVRGVPYEGDPSVWATLGPVLIAPIPGPIQDPPDYDGGTYDSELAGWAETDTGGAPTWVIEEAVAAYVGKRYAAINMAGGESGYILSPPVACTAGVPFVVKVAALRVSGAINVTAAYEVVFYKSSGVTTGSITVRASAPLTSSWVASEVKVTPPANSVYFRLKASAGAPFLGPMGAGKVAFSSPQFQAEVTGLHLADTLDLENKTVTLSGTAKIVHRHASNREEWQDEAGMPFARQGSSGTVAGGTAQVNLFAYDGTVNITALNGIRLAGNLPGVRISPFLEMPETTTPATPSSGNGRVYFKSNGKLYYMDDAGTEFEIATV